MIDIEPITALMAVVMFAAFCAPFVYHGLKQRKIKKKQLATLEALAKDASMILDVMNHWRNRYAIGLDQKQNLLVYVKFGEDGKTQVLDLNMPFEVKAQNHREEKQHGQVTSTSRNMDRLTLQIQSKASPNQQYSLEFYNPEVFSDQMGEILLIRKWEEILRSLAKKQVLVPS